MVARLEKIDSTVAGGFLFGRLITGSSAVPFVYISPVRSGRVRLRLAGNGQLQKWRYARTIRLSQCEMMGTVRLCRYQNGGASHDTATRAFADIQKEVISQKQP
jgi:hypothetical protein